MSDPILERDRAAEALRLVAEAAGPYLDSLTDRPVHDSTADALLDRLEGPLPEAGDGTLASVRELLHVGTNAATHSSGPRYFHLITGGATPAAQAADWVVSLLDQVAGLWSTSPFAARTETAVLGWLKELFGVPASYGAVLTPSATFANLTGLAAARYWWAEQHGVDVTADGLAGLPVMPVLSSGYVHPSGRKALQILGHGRDSVRLYTKDDTGRVDLDAMDRALAEIGGPAVIIGNAGVVNTGDFDPIDELADLAERHGAWLHVDGAFGLFAAVSPRLAHLVCGIERANSLASDGHKWLNVPYESGFAFVRDPRLLSMAFGGWNTAYLPSEHETKINYNTLGPESSRRARALPIWATLRAYGRQGYREMIERQHDLAKRLGTLIDQAPELELLEPVHLVIACFQYRPPGVPDADLDELNRELGDRLMADGRVHLGTTIYRGRTVLRATVMNWRTTEAEIDLLVSVVRELGARLTSGVAGGS